MSVVDWSIPWSHDVEVLGFECAMFSDHCHICKTQQKYCTSFYFVTPTSPSSFTSSTSNITPQDKCYLTLTPYYQNTVWHNPNKIQSRFFIQTLRSVISHCVWIKINDFIIHLFINFGIALENIQIYWKIPEFLITTLYQIG